MNQLPERLQHHPRVTVLICALNEEQSLPHVLSRVPEWVEEVLVVDGGSTDNTIRVVNAILPQAKVMRQPGYGKGNAIRYGVAESSGDIVVTLDADGQTDPSELENFISPLLAGCHFVKGSRFVSSGPLRMPFRRKLGNFVLAATFNVLYGTKFTDVCSGYNAFWHTTPVRIQRIPLRTDRTRKAGARQLYQPPPSQLE